MERALELIALALAAVRSTSVLAMPAVRRELRDRPVLAVVAGVGALAMLALVAFAVALDDPRALRGLAAFVLVGWLLLALRARESRGRRARRPPGSIGFRASLTAISEPDFYRDQMRKHGPVFTSAQFHRPVACVVGIDKGRTLLRRHPEELGPAVAPVNAVIPRGFLRFMSPEDHAYYAPLFRSAFADPIVHAVEPFARDATRRALLALADEGRQHPDGVDPKPALDRALLSTLQRLFFGSLFGEEDATTLDRYAHEAGTIDVIGRAAPAAWRAVRDFEALLFARAVSYDAAGDRSVWGEIGRLDPRAARDPTVAGNLLQLFQAAQHSIGGLSVWLVKKLAEASDWVARVRSTSPQDSPGRDPDDPYARAVLETLRLHQSEYVYREVRRPLALDGFLVPAGWLLRICVRESHRLPAVFERPEMFDPDRHRGRRFKANELSPFGLDMHACLGARMSILLGSILARQLVHDFDVRIVGDGPVQRDNRHWHHWRPNAAFRVLLQPRATAS